MRKPIQIAAGLLSLAFPGTAAAFEIPTDWYGPVCAFIPCTGVGTGAGATGLSNYLLDKVVTTIEVGFVAIALIILFAAAVNMVIQSEQEDVVKQSRSAFIYVIAGGGVVAFARWFALAFAPTGPTGDIVNTPVIDDAITQVLTFFKLILSILLSVNIVIQGVRLVTSQGEQEQTEKARKRLILGFVGVGLVLLANTIAVSVNPQLGSTTTLALEIAGIANYLLTILGFVAVGAIVVAGILLILSVDDSLKDKAKMIVKGAVIALVAILVSYALLTAFIGFQP